MTNALCPAERIETAISDEVDRLPTTVAGFARLALAGGKRIRPRVVEAFALACQGTADDWLRFAIAVEFIHKASLIQDDLPCMDSAVERSGRPAVHVVCSPAEAVLTSDTLMARAFGLCSESAWPAESVATLSQAVIALATGQAADLRPDGARSWSDWQAVSDAKTGALFVAAASLGVIASGRDSEPLRSAAQRFGRSVGRLYQWWDDRRDGDADDLPRSLVEPEFAVLRRLQPELPSPEPVVALLDDLVRIMR